MSSDRLLYFPYISIPNTAWLARALLYWETVGAIVPYDFLSEPEKLDTHMRELLTAGLVEPIGPGAYIQQTPDFTDAFVAFVENHPEISQVTPDQLTPQRTVKIHMEKLGEVADFLEDRELAEKAGGPSWDLWYRVERTTAYCFMTYLAGVLGEVTEFQPATDRARSLSDLVETADEEPKQRWRAHILDHLLPGPTMIESVDDFLVFKQRHESHLTRFRNDVEEFLLDLEAAPEEQHEERTDRFLAQAADEIEYIAGQMRAHKWNLLNLGTLCSVGASAASYLSGGDELATAAAGLSILSAVASALSPDQLKEVQRRPLAYAVLVDRAFDLQAHTPSGPSLSEVNDAAVLMRLLSEQPAP